MTEEPIYCSICGCCANSLECTATAKVTTKNGWNFCDVCCGGLPTKEEAFAAVRANGYEPVDFIKI